MNNNLLIQLNSSMGYVLRCDDGSTLVIDGGKDYHGDHLMEELHKLFGKERPVVDLWILTHPHTDHTYACKAIADRYGDAITVKALMFAFPPDQIMGELEAQVPQQCCRLFESLARFRDLQTIDPSAGERYWFGSVALDVLFTWKDLPTFCEGNWNLNDASLVFTLSLSRQKLMFLGDVSHEGCRVLEQRYGHALQSDVCQVSHHGWFGATCQLYQLVDPQILLWPSDVSMYEAATTIVWPSRYLLDELRVKEVYLAGEGAVSLPLPIALRQPGRIPPLPSRHRPVTPAFYARYAPEGFSWEDPSDPRWSRTEAIRGVSFRKNSEDAPCFVRVLWSENALFCKVDFAKALYPSSSEQTGTGNTNNVRPYLCERVVTDLFCRWEHCSEGGCSHHLKLFPEEKRFPFGFSQCNDKHFTSYRFIPQELGYTLLFRLEFQAPHKAGDHISFTVEVSAANPQGTNRVCRYLLTDGERDDYCAQTPSALPIFKLCN